MEEDVSSGRFYVIFDYRVEFWILFFSMVFCRYRNCLTNIEEPSTCLKCSRYRAWGWNLFTCVQTPLHSLQSSSSYTPLSLNRNSEMATPSPTYNGRLPSAVSGEPYWASCGVIHCTQRPLQRISSLVPEASTVSAFSSHRRRASLLRACNGRFRRGTFLRRALLLV